MDEKEHRLLFACVRRDTLAVEREFDAVLARPVFARLNVRLCFGLGAGHKADDARPCSRDDGSARDRTIHGFLLPLVWTHDSKSSDAAAVSSPRFGVREGGWDFRDGVCLRVHLAARPRSLSAD